MGKRCELSKTSKPSPQESYKIFKNIFSISENLETGFVKISIDHQSPHIAKSGQIF